MWLIKDEAQGLWAQVCKCAGSVNWFADPAQATQYATEEAAETAAVAHGISPDWVVPA